MSAVQISRVKVLAVPPGLGRLLWKPLLSVLVDLDTLQLALGPVQLVACVGKERLFPNLCRLAVV